jgi:hypothetical protein
VHACLASGLQAPAGMATPRLLTLPSRPCAAATTLPTIAAARAVWRHAAAAHGLRCVGCGGGSQDGVGHGGHQEAVQLHAAI